MDLKSVIARQKRIDYTEKMTINGHFSILSIIFVYFSLEIYGHFSLLI